MNDVAYGAPNVREGKRGREGEIEEAIEYTKMKCNENNMEIIRKK